MITHNIICDRCGCKQEQTENFASGEWFRLVLRSEPDYPFIEKHFCPKCTTDLKLPLAHTRETKKSIGERLVELLEEIATSAGPN